MAATEVILAGSYSPRIASWFAWYLRRMIHGKFHRVHLARGGVSLLESISQHNGPVSVLLSHSSWWDPLVGLFLADRFMSHRSGCGPMDINILRQFGFFRRLGLFGIEPDHPHAAEALKKYVLDCFAREPLPTLWITPHGKFHDPRESPEPRPGAASVCAAATRVRVVSIAMEYVFWLDKKPEILLRAQEIAAPASPSTAHWHREISRGTASNAAKLAELAVARDPNAFETLLASRTGTSAMYDLWLKLRGKSNTVTDAHRAHRSGEGAVTP